ncbi:MAG: type IV pilus secretin PilQ [Desulfobacula sp.]|uniref:type IV pilus secretin family protein n=1 Tax=Desulfobacula sp. TaxID=2593537 RepID=UPI0025C0B963|nr:type IV pilus secretin family protein [Desulfobacula sp.]MCD4722015.1 type IV pilus secretin PilQ [Desulfobacula sp.]
MIHLITRSIRKEALIIFLLSAAMIFAGCASNKADVEKIDNVEVSLGPNLITDIVTAEDSESTYVTVRGNRYLTYTSIKQDIPLGILFYFHETDLDESIQSTYMPESDIIASIETSELTDQEGTTRILISLKKDIPYDVTPDDTGIKISFSKAAEIPVSSDLAEGSETPELVQATKPVEVIVPAATILKSVDASKLKESVKINVIADGIIKDYKSFTIASPARIVFDIYNIKSPFKKQKTIPVNSKWVRKVRHYGYPDKVRVVIDTKKKYFSAFSAYSIDTGLEIHVGKDTGAPLPASSEKVFTPVKEALVPGIKPVAADKMKPASAYTKPAWINRIDFLGKETGKSTVIIGTTHPVDYDINEVTDKLLRIKLFNTKLPKYRKRPLITTRFESAVDRITPFFKPAVKNTSIIAIELREKVPYTLEQKEDLLLIHFETSSIPPKPFEQANLPSWKKVFAQMDVETEVTTPEKTEDEMSLKTDDTILPITAETIQAEAKDAVSPKVSERTDMKARLEGSSSVIDIMVHRKTPKRYRGEKIALDFYETDIKNVFRILKEISGSNFAIDKDVTGKVTLSFDKPVPWDQVLDLVLKMNQLGMTYEGDIIRVATLASLAREEKMRQARIEEEKKTREAEKALEPLVTKYISVNYSDANAEILPHVKKIMTDKRGSVSVDKRNNQLIVTDTAGVIEKIKEIVARIDTVTPQVIIEAKIVEVSSNFSNDIGIDWSGNSNGDQSDNTWLDGNVAMNFPAASSGVLGFTFNKIAGTSLILNAQLTAMETRGEGKIISSPRIATLDNKTATITQGVEYPYLERDSAGLATVKFKDIDLTLEVTPTVSPDDRILMKINISKDDVASLTADGTPSLSTNEAKTELLVNDGDTIVIGGILKSSVTTGDSGWPGLKSIPLLGWLFKKESKSSSNTELLIFITPTIVQLEQRRQ